MPGSVEAMKAPPEGGSRKAGTTQTPPTACQHPAPPPPGAGRPQGRDDSGSPTPGGCRVNRITAAPVLTDRVNGATGSGGGWVSRTGQPPRGAVTRRGGTGECRQGRGGATSRPPGDDRKRRIPVLAGLPSRGPPTGRFCTRSGYHPGTCGAGEPVLRTAAARALFRSGGLFTPPVSVVCGGHRPCGDPRARDASVPRRRVGQHGRPLPGGRPTHCAVPCRRPSLPASAWGGSPA